MRETARFFKVLSDDARLKMLWLLFNYPELCVCDIMAALEITQSKASRHLAALRNAGLATDRKEGLWSYYSLRPLQDSNMKAQLKLLKRSLSEQADAEQLLTKLKDWLKAKKSTGVCLTADERIRAPKHSRKRSRRLPHAGGTR